MTNGIRTRLITLRPNGLSCGQVCCALLYVFFVEETITKARISYASNYKLKGMKKRGWEDSVALKYILRKRRKKM